MAHARAGSPRTTTELGGSPEYLIRVGGAICGVPVMSTGEGETMAKSLRRPAVLPSADPSTPSHVGIGGFVIVVLGLSALKLLPALLEGRGVPVPTWLDPLALVLGGGFSPLWALLVVGSMTVGWTRVRRLLLDSLRWRVDGRLYTGALLGPFAVLAVAALASGTRPAGIDAEPLALVGQIVLVAPLFALTEQLGWRAWLQRGLQARTPPALAGALVGVVWVVHHLPLFAPDSPSLHTELPLPGFATLVVTFSVLLAAVFNAAGGSVLPVVVAHVSWNLAVQVCLPADPSRATPLFLTAAALFAAIVLLVARWSRARAGEQHESIL